jgi:hypothetical protein
MRAGGQARRRAGEVRRTQESPLKVTHAGKALCNALGPSGQRPLSCPCCSMRMVGHGVRGGQPFFETNFAMLVASAVQVKSHCRRTTCVGHAWWASVTCSAIGRAAQAMASPAPLGGPLFGLANARRRKKKSKKSRLARWPGYPGTTLGPAKDAGQTRQGRPARRAR